MRLQIEQLVLVGTSRQVDFEPGLNVILGPTSTGKSSLMNLIRVFLGGGYSPKRLPEVKASVSDLAGALVVGGQGFSIRRPLVTTPTASVEIAGGDNEVLALPAMTAEAQGMSYGDWLLGKLDLPILRVPSAPTKPAESEPTKVSINDYLRYCRLTEDQIDTDVLGSSSPFSDYKRRVVFRILYAAYDTEIARLQQELRELASEIRRMEASEGAAKLFLEGTSFENRAAVDQRLREVEARRESVLEEANLEANDVAEASQSQELKERAAELDALLAKDRGDRARESEAAQSLVELRNQLVTQSARLTRAIVAGEAFFDFDFRVCPRCGNEVEPDEAEGDECYLCRRPQPVVQGREDLVREQARIAAQIAETEELIADHERAAEDVASRVESLEADRRTTGRLLDEATASFVSDRAEASNRRAAEASRLAAEVGHLGEYLSLFERQEAIKLRLTTAVADREGIETALEQAEAREGSLDVNLRELDSRFSALVESVGVPRFDGNPQPRAAIDRNDYQPIVNGRKIDGLSAGTRVLVNVAHLLAHHEAAPTLGVPLPGLLLIDGMTANLGKIDYDAERIENIWGELLRLHEEKAEELQIIVSANGLPDRHDVTDFVRLELSEEDRLVPTEDLARARSSDGG